jgi:hypothetical protein
MRNLRDFAADAARQCGNGAAGNGGLAGSGEVRSAGRRRFPDIYAERGHRDTVQDLFRRQHRPDAQRLGGVAGQHGEDGRGDDQGGVSVSPRAPADVDRAQRGGEGPQP